MRRSRESLAADVLKVMKSAEALGLELRAKVNPKRQGRRRARKRPSGGRG